MKILIISALPFDVSSSTRAFKTYFYRLDKNDIAQIYTNPSTPDYSYCRRFYQITDNRVLKSRFCKGYDPGTEFLFNGKITQNNMTEAKNNSFLKKDIGFIHLARMALWKEDKWFTPKLINWVESFAPDLVFYHNSNSLFISKIATRISSYFNLPLVVEISDDYFFNRKKSPFVFSSIYNAKYKKWFLQTAKLADGCFFVSEKMKRKYAGICPCNSDVVHIASDTIQTNTNCAVFPNTFCYFGNTGFKRGLTLRKLGKKLKSINNEFAIDVYSPLQGNRGLDKNKKYPGIRQCGNLKYAELISKIKTYEYIILAEPLDNKTANYIGLSLSTKVGDMMALKKKIISVGNISSGTIEYISNHKCGLMLFSDNDIRSLSLDKIVGYNWNEAVDNCVHAFKNDFSIESNAEKALSIMKTAIAYYDKKNKKC